MKGLLIKDFMLVKNQKQFFGIALVMMVILMTANHEATFAVSYMMIMFSVFVITTISYDKYEKGLGYLFTLPVSRKKYVQEKYLFALIMMFFALVVVAVILTAVMTAQIISWNPEEMFMTIGGACWALIIMDSIMIPLQMKFEAERMQMIYIALFGGTFLGAYLISYIAKEAGIDLEEVLGRILAANEKAVVAGCILFAAAVLLASYLISLRIMKKKEF